MITIPASLKTEIQKLRGRHLQARCKIDYSGVNIDNSIMASSNGTQEYSNITQLYNGKNEPTYKWASLDGSWVLGEHYLAPFTEAEYLQNEIGWWGTNLSMASGEFQNGEARLYSTELLGEIMLDKFIGYPEASVNFSARYIQELAVSFDNKRYEFAIDFDIILYNSSYVEVYRESILDNHGLNYTKTITAVPDVCVVKIIIYTWSSGSRQAKIVEMFTAVSEMYTGSDILNLKVIENRELPKDGAILGSTASGQVVLSIVNKNRKFDYDNTASFLYNLIRAGARILPEIGDGTDWIPLGVYYAKEWDISKRKIDVTITGMDAMAGLGESEYTKNSIIVATSPISYDIDTDAEWNSGTKTNIIVSSNTIRMVF